MPHINFIFCYNTIKTFASHTVVDTSWIWGMGSHRPGRGVLVTRDVNQCDWTLSKPLIRSFQKLLQVTQVPSKVNSWIAKTELNRPGALFICHTDNINVAPHTTATRNQYTGVSISQQLEAAIFSRDLVYNFCTQSSEENKMQWRGTEGHIYQNPVCAYTLTSHYDYTGTHIKNSYHLQEPA